MATVNTLCSVINLLARSAGEIPSIPTLAIPQLLLASAGVLIIILGIKLIANGALCQNLVFKNEFTISIILQWKLAITLNIEF